MRAPSSALRAARGFSLIEILVVVALFGIMAGAVALNLMRDERDVVRGEAERLAALLQATRDEAILRGGILAFQVRGDRYQFLQPGDDGKFKYVERGELEPRQLPKDVSASLEIDGQDGGGNKLVIFDSTGSMPVFRIVFRLREARWWVIVDADGNIRPAQTANDENKS